MCQKAEWSTSRSILTEVSCKSKVAELDNSVLANEDVFRLHVPVDHLSRSHDNILVT